MSELVTTFRVGKEMFGLEVMQVQEVTSQPIIVPVPLSPPFILGLINLRGQLSTALGLRELFESESIKSADQMSVVCRLDGNLVSLIVDEIGDVVQVDPQNFESPPDLLPAGLRPFIKGIYKMNGSLLTILNLDQISKQLSPSFENNELRPQNRPPQRSPQ